jgi:hypothetical protein
VEEFICNECRFDHKKKEDWMIEGPSHIERHSVISQNHYELKEPVHRPNLNAVPVVGDKLIENKK